MARERGEKGTQRIYPVKDAFIDSPQYETAYGMSNTEAERKDTKSHSCKCKKKDKKKNMSRRDRSWHSITNLYGDADTTEVWDHELQRPKAIYERREQQVVNPYFNDENYELNDFQENIDPMYNIKPKPAKMSLLSLYRRHKRNKYRKKQHPNETPPYEPNVEFKFTKKPGKKFVIDRFATGDVCRGGPCTEVLENLYKLHNAKELKILKKKLKDNKIAKGEERRKELLEEEKGKKKKKKKDKEKKKKKKDEDEDKDKDKEKKKKKKTIKKGQEELDLVKNKNDDNKKYSKLFSKVRTIKGNAKNSLMKIRKERSSDLNIGQGDQNKDLKGVKPKASFIDKMFRHTCKCKSDNGRALQTVLNAKDQTGEPFFEMRVDSSDMHVINSPEINKKIRKLGRSQRKLSCMCPSRLNRLQLYKEKGCRRGICEKALKTKQTNFDCKCVNLNEVVECKDTTCDLKVKREKKKNRKKKGLSPTAATAINNKPLFQVMLDSKNMNIVNSNEIREVIRKASAREVCSTGICKTAKNKNVELNCRCIGKKLKAGVYECDNSSCRDSRKKCALSFYCSRIFSKSENRSLRERRRRKRAIRGTHYPPNTIQDNTNVRSDTKRAIRGTHYPPNTIQDNTNVRSDTKHDRKEMTFKISRLLKKEQKKDPQLKGGHANICECKQKKKKKTKRKRRRKRKGFFKRRKRDDRTCSEKVEDCVEKEQEECEKRLKKKKKLYKKQEKKALKENKKMEAEQRKTSKKNEHRLNYITNMISGFFNVTIGTIKTAIKIPFWVLGDPIGSYVYVREKVKDPPASLLRILYWFIRTWNNQSSPIAKRLQESSTVNIIADQIEDSAVYNAIFTSKGKSKSERALYERRSRIRKRRIKEREDRALYGCRHILLTTMRKTPCLWFYHVCPDLYPQCLSLVSFMNNFFHILIYLMAILMWTPCILTFEMCRAFLCCFFCTH